MVKLYYSLKITLRYNSTGKAMLYFQYCSTKTTTGEIGQVQRQLFFPTGRVSVVHHVTMASGSTVAKHHALLLYCFTSGTHSNFSSSRTITTLEVSMLKENGITGLHQHVLYCYNFLSTQYSIWLGFESLQHTKRCMNQTTQSRRKVARLTLDTQATRELGLQR